MEPRQCTIQFNEEAHAKAAFFLSGTPLGDRPLTVSLQPIILYTPQAQQMVYPEGSPLAAAQKREQLIARTIYVGNLNLAIEEEALRQFFSTAGVVTATKLAGDTVSQLQEGKATRFAFVEFETPEMAQMALTLQGTVLAEKAIKVGKAVNPIQRAEEPQKNISEIMKKVLAHTEKLNSKVSGSRSRSRSRDRSRRRRSSRSRSRDRARDRDRRRRSPSPKALPPARPKKEEKPKVDRTGMFFDGYRWQPIQPILPGPVPIVSVAMKR